MPKATYNEPGTAIRARGASFRVYEWSGGGPPTMHVHFDDDEAWHMLQGTLTFEFEEGSVDVGPGQTMFVPAGVPHTFDEKHGPTRYLMILTPRLDALIEALHEAPPERHRAIMEAHRSKQLDEEEAP